MQQTGGAHLVVGDGLADDGHPDAAYRPRNTGSLIQVKGSRTPLPHDPGETGSSGPEQF